MIKRLVSFAIIAILLVLVLALPSSAATSYVYDPDGHLSESDKYAIESYLVNLNNGSYISYYLVVSDRESDAYKHSYGDTVTLWVDPVGYSGTYEYELIVYGYADSEMSYRESDMILDDPDVYNNIKSGNIRIGALRAFELVDIAVHGDLRAENWILKTILTSFVFAAVISAIVCGIIIYKYKKNILMRELRCLYTCYKLRRDKNLNPLKKYKWMHRGMKGIKKNVTYSEFTEGKK